MRIGYIHVDYEEWTDSNYNTQEIGLAKAFVSLGHEVIVVYWVKKTSNKCFKEIEIVPGIKKVYLPTLHLKHHVIFNPNYLKRYAFDLVHIQSDNLLYVPEVIRFCRKNKIPYYCYIGTLKSRNSNLFYRKIIDTLSKRNLKFYKKSKTYVKTPSLQDEMSLLGIDTEVAPVGLDLSIIPQVNKLKEEICEYYNISTNKKIILCVSALRPDRQPLDFFDLIDRLKDEYCYIFIGKGELENVFQLEKNKRKEVNNIIYFPEIPNSDIHSFYKISDYVVNFNENEIFGMSILEAMYQGATVVALSAPGPDFTINNGVSGFIVESIDKMVEIIEQDLRIGEQATKHVKDSFTWDKMAGQVISYYDSIRENI